MAATGTVEITWWHDHTRASLKGVKGQRDQNAPNLPRSGTINPLNLPRSGALNPLNLKRSATVSSEALPRCGASSTFS